MLRSGRRSDWCEKVVTVNAWERFRQTAVRLCSCPQSNSAESHKSCKRESKSISRSSPPAWVPLPPLWIRWKIFPGSRKCFSSTLLLTRYTNLVERSVKELILQNRLETFPRCLWWKGWLTSHKKTTFSTIVLITKTVFGFLHTTFGLIYSLASCWAVFLRACTLTRICLIQTSSWCFNAASKSDDEESLMYKGLTFPSPVMIWLHPKRVSAISPLERQLTHCERTVWLAWLSYHVVAHIIQGQPITTSPPHNPTPSKLFSLRLVHTISNV